MTTNKIIFVNRVFWPAEDATAQLLYDLATGLAATGSTVEIVTASDGAESLSPASGAAIKIHRLDQNRMRTVGLLAKAMGYLRFALRAREAIKRIVRPGDRVVAMTDPPLLGPWLGQLARDRGAHMWHWSQDLYPEVALAIAPFGVFTKILGNVKGWRDREWRAATGVVAIGDDMATKIRARQVSPDKIQISGNWCPAGLNFADAVSQREAWNVSSDDFVVAYSGNLGRAHTLAPLVELAARFSEESAVKFLVIGQGPQKSRLEQRAEELKAVNCRFLPPAPRSDLGRNLAAADLHVITMRADCVGVVWPSKFYGIVAAGRPILFIGPADAEIAQIITREGLGIAVAENDFATAEDFIVSLRGDPNRQTMLRRRLNAFHRDLPGLAGAVASWQRWLTSPVSS